MKYINNITNNCWKTLTLAECLDSVVDHRGLTPKKLGGIWSNSGVQSISAKNIKSGSLLKFDSSKLVSEELYRRWMPVGLDAGDILLTSEAPLGELYLVKKNERFCLSQRLFGLKVRRDIVDPAYLLYFLDSPKGKNELHGRATGSVVTGIRQSELLKVEIDLPALVEQKKIASILSSVDGKIELNRQINASLEKIANALFKRWFVEFEFPNEYGKPYKSSGGKMVDSEFGKIPEGWELGKLADEFEIVMGQSPSGDTYNEKGNGLPLYQGSTDFGDRFPSRRIYCTDPKRQAQALDTLISVRAPVGDINMAIEACCIGRGVGAIRKVNFPSYTFYKIKSLQTEIGQFDSEGTVFGSINKNSLADIHCLLPKKSVLTEFERIATALDLEILNLTLEIRNLSGIRDSILPRLMNGKITVKLN